MGKNIADSMGEVLGLDDKMEENVRIPWVLEARLHPVPSKRNGHLEADSHPRKDSIPRNKMAASNKAKNSNVTAPTFIDLLLPLGTIEKNKLPKINTFTNDLKKTIRK